MKKAIPLHQTLLVLSCFLYFLFDALLSAFHVFDGGQRDLARCENSSFVERQCGSLLGESGVGSLDEVASGTKEWPFSCSCGVPTNANKCLSELGAKLG